MAETGVGPYKPAWHHNQKQGYQPDYIEIKAYYQWVPFVLFLQACMFYIPHIVYKNFEGGKLKLIITGLNQWVLSDSERHSKESELASYLIQTSGTHQKWCIQLIFARSLYLVSMHSASHDF